MSKSLTDVYNDISSQDAALLEKQASFIKEAEEQDAAGRITARGFMDELHKIAARGMPSFGGMKRTPRVPSIPNPPQGKGQFGKGKAIAPSGKIVPKGMKPPMAAAPKVPKMKAPAAKMPSMRGAQAKAF